MPFDPTTLDSRADATCGLLVHIFDSQKIVDEVWSSYEEMCRTPLAQGLGIKPREMRPDDRARVTFELLCFCAFVVMTDAVPKRIVRRRALFGTTPDTEAIDAFNRSLLKAMESHCRHLGLDKVREIVVTAITPEFQFGLGDSQDCAKRIAVYAQSAAAKIHAARRLEKLLPDAVDPDNYPIVQIVAARFAPRLASLSREALRLAFDDPGQSVTA